MSINPQEFELNETGVKNLKELLEKWKPGDRLLHSTSPWGNAWMLTRPYPGEPEGWLVEPSDIDELVELLRLKPWQKDRLGYWLDHVRQFRREKKGT